MKKKVIGFLLTMILLLQPVSVHAADTVTANGNGLTEIPFSNSYRGYCVNWDYKGAEIGRQYSVAGTQGEVINIDGTDVSQQLKILFTQCFEYIFVEDPDTGGYKMKPNTSSSNTSSNVQYTIYHYTDNFKSNWGDQLTWINVIDSYSGAPIPDSGYVRTLSTGDKITFYFMLMKAGEENYQNFFAYKISVTKASEHVHSGGTPTCKEEAVCEGCGESYGDIDKNNHVGETEIIGAKEATTEVEGYTGDTYCKDCGGKIADGEVIPKVHEHNHSDKWDGDEDEHWHECACGENGKAACSKSG